DPLNRPMLTAQLLAQLTHQPHRPLLLLHRVPTRVRLPRRQLLWHDSILVSKLRSLQPTQGDSTRRPWLRWVWAVPARCPQASTSIHRRWRWWVTARRKVVTTPAVVPRRMGSFSTRPRRVM